MLEKENNEPAGKKYKLPKTSKWVDYDTYRELTGKCETCNAQMNTHPKCDACGALCGEGHLEDLPSRYQEHETMQTLHSFMERFRQSDWKKGNLE